MCAAFIVTAPVAIVLAIWSIFEMRRDRSEGLLFAGGALLLAGVLLPGAAYFMLSGNPRIGDPCRALQDQARGGLRVVHYLQEKYHEDHGTYGSFEDIGFSSAYGDEPYLIELISHSSDEYLARATGNGRLVAGDTLEVRKDGRVQLTRALGNDRQ